MQTVYPMRANYGYTHKAAKSYKVWNFVSVFIFSYFLDHEIESSSAKIIPRTHQYLGYMSKLWSWKDQLLSFPQQWKNGRKEAITATLWTFHYRLTWLNTNSPLDAALSLPSVTSLTRRWNWYTENHSIKHLQPPITFKLTLYNYFFLHVFPLL